MFEQCVQVSSMYNQDYNRQGLHMNIESNKKLYDINRVNMKKTYLFEMNNHMGCNEQNLALKKYLNLFS